MKVLAPPALRPGPSLPLAIALALGALPAPAPAFPGGPPDGRAGEPPAYITCQDCHGRLTGDGQIALLDVPLSGYTPNQSYPITVELRDPGQRRWGFELTVLDDATLQQAGTLVVTDVLNTQLSEHAGSAPDYLKQTLDGTHNGTMDGPVAWPFEWIAPAAGNATFYLAGNAANGNGMSSGDVIYWIQRPVAPVSALEPVGSSPAAVLLLPAFPNPLLLQATIPFELSASARVRLRIHDVAGRLVRTLLDAELPAGRHETRWDGLDAAGRPAPSGVYLYRLEVTGTGATRRLIVLK